MIGEKLIDAPKVIDDCWKVFEFFGLVLPKNSDYIFENATQLVKLNNEVCHKLNQKEHGGLVNMDEVDYDLKWMGQNHKI